MAPYCLNTLDQCCSLVAGGPYSAPEILVLSNKPPKYNIVRILLVNVRILITYYINSNSMELSGHSFNYKLKYYDRVIFRRLLCVN